MSGKRYRKSSSDIEIIPSSKFQKMSLTPESEPADQPLHQLRGQVSNETILNEILGLKTLISQVQRDNVEMKMDFQRELSNLKEELNDTLGRHIQSLERKIDMEVNHVIARVEAVEDRVDRIDKHVSERDPFEPDVTVVAYNVKTFVNEQIESTTKRMLDVMGLNQTKIVRVERLESRGRKPGLVKIELENIKEKVKVLRNKYNLNLSRDFTGVFIRSAQTHAERTQERNMKVILKELPNGNNYKLTGHGILVRKEETNEQRGTINRNNVFTADQGPNFTNNGPTPTRQVTYATAYGCNTMGHTNTGKLMDQQGGPSVNSNNAIGPRPNQGQGQTAVTIMPPSTHQMSAASPPNLRMVRPQQPLVSGESSPTFMPSINTIYASQPPMAPHKTAIPSTSGIIDNQPNVMNV